MTEAPQAALTAPARAALEALDRAVGQFSRLGGDLEDSIRQ